MEKKLHPSTLCVHAGYSPANGEPRQMPIIQSTTFKYTTSDEMGRLFDLEASGYVCRTRPTTAWPRAWRRWKAVWRAC